MEPGQSCDELACMQAIKDAVDQLSVEQITRVAAWTLEYMRNAAKVQLAQVADEAAALSDRIKAAT